MRTKVPPLNWETGAHWYCFSMGRPPASTFPLVHGLPLLLNGITLFR